MVKLVALLRAVNVGVTGKLPMKDLVQLCIDAGFEDPQTYIASGNAVFSTSLSIDQAKTTLEEKLTHFAGKPVGTFLRTGTELKSILDANPFPGQPGNQTMVIFLDAKPTSAMLGQVVGQKNEVIRLGEREIYVHYPEGIGRSKLKIAAAETGTARNMNTVSKLVAMTCDA